MRNGLELAYKPVPHSSNCRAKSMRGNHLALHNLKACLIQSGVHEGHERSIGSPLSSPPRRIRNRPCPAKPHEECCSHSQIGNRRPIFCTQRVDSLFGPKDELFYVCCYWVTVF